MGGWITAESRGMEREQVQKMMDCYGKRYSGQDDSCRGCEIKVWCKEAGDGSPLRGLPLLDIGNDDKEDERLSEYQLKRYSYADIVTVIRYLSNLPAPVLKALSCTLSADGVVNEAKLSALARHLRVSRQALWKSLHRAYLDHPELKKVFIYRRKRK